MPRFVVTFAKGVGFRLSPNLHDRAPGLKPARRGEELEGEVTADGQWLELGTGEGLFLPVYAPDGTPLLTPLDAEPRKGRFVPWQGADDEGTSRPSPTSRARSAPGTERAPAAVAPGARSDELAELDAQYDARQRRRGPGSGNGSVVSRLPPPPRRVSRARSQVGEIAPAPALGQLVNSHDKTTAYMHEFREALEEMGMDTRDDAYLNVYAPIGGAVDAVVPKAAAGVLQERRRSGAPRGGSRPNSSGSAAAAAAGAEVLRGRGRQAGGVPQGRDAPSVDSHLTLCGAMVTTRSAPGGPEGRWKAGPRNAIVPVKEWRSVKHGEEVQNTCSSGRVVDLSDRNILCMSVMGEKAVFGSCDHALKEVNVPSARMLRNLFTQRCGHAEWVTSVSHCPDGRIVSGGADSKLCVWNASGASCVDMTGHLGSVSRVRVDARGRLAISSAYDRTLGVWDLRSKRQAAQCFGHNAPVLDFVWWDTVVASGDRSGIVKLWDTGTAQTIGTLKGHKGHITAMLAMPPDGGEAEDGDADGGNPTVLTGAQDGHIRVWDLRQRLNTCNLSCHPGGAVNDLGATVARASPLVVSTGADGRVLVLEPRCGYAPLHEFSGLTEDFLYSLLVLDDVAFVGDGRGRVQCLDLDTGQQQYELNAGENAIRCLGATSASLICAGDDGNALIFDF